MIRPLCRPTENCSRPRPVSPPSRSRDAAYPRNGFGMFRIAGESYWEVQINGKGVDLAYLYFAKKSDKWVNAAMEAKIDVSDVPKELSRELLGK